MNEMVKSGATVSLVFYVEGHPVGMTGHVEQQDPFCLHTDDENAALLETGRRAMLIIQNGRDFSKAEAELFAHKTEHGWVITASSFGWETVDRRRYPRYPVNVNITVRAVLEEEGEAQLVTITGMTEDISIGGAWVKTPETLKGGSLVEVSTDLGGTQIRALSIVKWADSDHSGLGFGVEFLDFLGGSRYALHQFLTQKAA